MDEIIQRAKNIHGNQYEYSNVEYVNIMTKVKIVCKTHGLFLQTINDHINGKYGCKNCGVESMKTKTRKKNGLDWLHELAIKNNGVLLSEEYINTTTKYLWKCKNNHEFFTTAKDISGGHWCAKCGFKKSANSNRKNIEWIINLAKHNGGTCLSKHYTVTSNKYIFKCKKNHTWVTTANIIQQGCWCPECKESKGEKYIKYILKKLNIQYIKEYRNQNCKNKNTLPFDFYLLDYNCCIEYDGEQHFGISYGLKFNHKKISTNDQIKNKFCQDNNIKLIRIPYTKFNEIETIINTEYQRGFDRSLDLSEEVHNKFNSTLHTING